MSERHTPPIQERERVWSRRIVVLSVSTFLIMAAALVVSTLLLGRDLRADSGGRDRETAARHRAPEVIGVVEQGLLNRGHDALGEDAKRERALASYGWVDRDKGLAKIPIERAMALVVARQARRAAAIRDADGGASP
jgi:hypothetical protein